MANWSHFADMIVITGIEGNGQWILGHRGQPDYPDDDDGENGRLEKRREKESIFT